MAATYVPISVEEMEALMLDKLGFEDVTQREGTIERIFEKQIVSASGIEYPYAVRVYSSIYPHGSKACGKDAIRVVLIDLEEKNPKFRHKKILGEGKVGKAGRRIHRTEKAMINLEKRVKQYIWHVISNPCPKCGSLMAIKKRKDNGKKFFSCTKWITTKCTGSNVFVDFDEWYKNHLKKRQAA